MSQPPTLKIESTKGRRLFAIGISNRVLIANASRGNDTIQLASRPVPEGDEIIITLNGVPHTFTYTYARPDFDEILLRRPVGIEDFEPAAPVPVKIEKTATDSAPANAPPALEDRRASTPVGGTGAEIALYQAVSPGVRPFDSDADTLITDKPDPDLSTLIVEDGKLAPPGAPPDAPQPPPA